jgi:hypothetical protein
LRYFDARKDSLRAESGIRIGEPILSFELRSPGKRQCLAAPDVEIDLASAASSFRESLVGPVTPANDRRRIRRPCLSPQLLFGLRLTVVDLAQRTVGSQSVFRGCQWWFLGPVAFYEAETAPIPRFWAFLRPLVAFLDSTLFAKILSPPEKGGGIASFYRPNSDLLRRKDKVSSTFCARLPRTARPEFRQSVLVWCCPTRQLLRSWLLASVNPTC